MPPEAPFPEGALQIPAPVWAEMLAHVRAAHPNEGCGLLSGHAGQVMRFYPTANAHPQPRTRYSIDPPELLRALRAIDAAGEELLAIFHSHPASPAYPSQTDVAQAYYPDTLYLIVSLVKPEQPVLRGFWLRDGVAAEHGVSIR